MALKSRRDRGNRVATADYVGSEFWQLPAVSHNSEPATLYRARIGPIRILLPSVLHSPESLPMFNARADEARLLYG